MYLVIFEMISEAITDSSWLQVPAHIFDITLKVPLFIALLWKSKSLDKSGSA